jgi:RES domain-containing protein
MKPDAQLIREARKDPDAFAELYLRHRAALYRWLRKRASAALRVPSAIIPEEHNVVLNVDHIDFGRIEFGPPSKFIFGVRT